MGRAVGELHTARWTQSATCSKIISCCAISLNSPTGNSLSGSVKRLVSALRGGRGRAKRETEQQQRQQKKTQQRKEPQPKREEVKLPRTVEEALAILHLTPPVTASDIKRAYRTQAFKSHPDRGGSHAAMVKINAAYELALAAC